MLEPTKDAVLRRTAQLDDLQIQTFSPGWSYDLLLVGEPEKLESPEGAQPFAEEEIRQRLAEAEAVLEKGSGEAAYIPAAIHNARRQAERMAEYRASLIARVVTGKLDERAATERTGMESAQL